MFPPLPRISLNSRAHHPLDPDLGSKVAKRLQNEIARRNGFTESLCSCLLGVEEKHCTEKTTLRVSKLKLQRVSVFTDDSQMTRHLGTLERNIAGQIQSSVQMVSPVKEQNLDLDLEADHQS